MSLPCDIDGFPRLVLSQAEERFMRQLVLDRPVRKDRMAAAIWLNAAPPNHHQRLHALACRVRVILSGLDRLLIYDPQHRSYTMIRDSRQFD